MAEPPEPKNVAVAIHRIRVVRLLVAIVVRLHQRELEYTQSARVLVGRRSSEGLLMRPAPHRLTGLIRDQSRCVEMIGVYLARLASTQLLSPPFDARTKFEFLRGERGLTDNRAGLVYDR